MKFFPQPYWGGSSPAVMRACVPVPPDVLPRLQAVHASMSLRAKQLLSVSFFQVHETVRIETSHLADRLCLFLGRT